MVKEITEKLKSSTAIEINGVTFHSFQEMLIYMDKQKNEIESLKVQLGKLKEENKKAKEIIKRLMDIINHDLRCFDTIAGLNVKQKAEQFLKECEE